MIGHDGGLLGVFLYNFALQFQVIFSHLKWLVVVAKQNFKSQICSIEPIKAQRVEGKLLIQHHKIYRPTHLIRVGDVTSSQRVTLLASIITENYNSTECSEQSKKHLHWSRHGCHASKREPLVSM